MVGSNQLKYHEISHLIQLQTLGFGLGPVAMLENPSAVAVPRRELFEGFFEGLPRARLRVQNLTDQQTSLHTVD